MHDNFDELIAVIFSLLIVVYSQKTFFLYAKDIQIRFLARLGDISQKDPKIVKP